MIKKTYIGVVAIILATVLITGCTNQTPTQNNGDGGTTIQVGDLTITSSAFVDGGNIPIKYSCDGDDPIGISPPLSFENVPNGTESLVLIVDDPDAPGEGPWVHWIVFNMPADTTGLEEDAIHQFYVGINSWDEIAYGGPCPPIGETHDYYFRLYALDITLDLLDGATRTEVDNAMAGHILAQTFLRGVYSA
jgi:Raf kinase inhibitor-like YbhB/YbcL family protein